MADWFGVMAFGAIGVSLRFGLDVWILSQWPGYGFVGTLFINVVGAFAIGMCLAFSRGGTVNETLYRFLTVGLLGGFTTFSAYAVQAFQMFNEGQIGLAAGYFVGSPLLAVGAVSLAYFLFRT
jgi:fluoride exporter